MKFVKAFGYFWYDFIVGDDWKVATYVVAILAVVGVLAAQGTGADAALVIGGSVALAAAFVIGVNLDANRMS
ncbi:MAG: hypothetical protein ACRDO7_11105 [Nocardioidaceae bacterium]